MNPEDKDSDFVALLRMQKGGNIICDWIWSIKGYLLSSGSLTFLHNDLDMLVLREITRPHAVTAYSLP